MVVWRSWQELQGDRAASKFVNSFVTERLLHASPIRGEPGEVRVRFVAEGNQPLGHAWQQAVPSYTPRPLAVNRPLSLA